MIRAGCQHKEGPAHDCDHVDERDTIAAHAAKIAAEIAGPRPNDVAALSEWQRAWDRAYWSEIRYQDRLARESQED